MVWAELPRLPYGIARWPAAIALAHEIAARPLRGLRMLELGAGTGLPGNLAPGGCLLLSDPFRSASIGLLEAMEADGWNVTFNKWTVAVVPPPRAAGVFE
jgi:predicted nicotinamide N-methyase